MAEETMLGKKRSFRKGGGNRTLQASRLVPGPLNHGADSTTGKNSYLFEREGRYPSTYHWRKKGGSGG